MNEPQLIPNPAATDLEISLPGESAHWIISIFSLQGIPLTRLEDKNTSIFRLNVSQVPAGTYVCRMISPGRAMFSTKLVIIH
ncbi:MAG: T9SS type A sorting domain-containing protein [Bacteroidales bacterium]